MALFCMMMTLSGATSAIHTAQPAERPVRCVIQSPPELSSRRASGDPAQKGGGIVPDPCDTAYISFRMITAFAEVVINNQVQPMAHPVHCSRSL
jgi:hypothetical protein